MDRELTDTELLDLLIGGHPFTSMVYEEIDPEHSGVATIRHRALRSRKDIIDALRRREEKRSRNAD